MIEEGPMMGISLEDPASLDGVLTRTPTEPTRAKFGMLPPSSKSLKWLEVQEGKSWSKPEKSLHSLLLAVAISSATDSSKWLIWALLSLALRMEEEAASSKIDVEAKLREA